MPPRLKRISSREVLRALGRFGFEVVVTKGSHAKVRRALPDGTRQTMTVPIHKELAPGTLRAIYRQALQFIPESQLRPFFFND